MNGMYLLGGVGGGQVFFHLLLHGLTDVVVSGILKVGLHLIVNKRLKIHVLFLFIKGP